eukprot:gb/GECG01000714.1/.p1 GENE.gb/GECG01000714.1/~~gb/GECG01000714.1/.p1  ORF type:complete len:502 (+),score=57.52 gb/GECG01000714.1/:1-1506(+)
MRRPRVNAVYLLLVLSAGFYECWGCMNRLALISQPPFWKFGAKRMSTCSSVGVDVCTKWPLNRVLELSAARYGRFGKLQRRASEEKQKPIGSHQTCHLVVGNQACDADSIISAISYAYVKQIEMIHEGDTNSFIESDVEDAAQSFPHIYAPIISCEREDFVLRREATYLLELAGVDTSLLTFLDDVDFKMWESSFCLDSTEKVQYPQAALALVDHNAPEGPFANSWWESATEEIVDHHRDDRKVDHVTGSARSISFNESLGKGVGSTCTLVAEAASKRVPFVLEQEPALTKILMGTILLDTVNCSESAGKTTAKDKEVIEKLKKAIAPYPGFEPNAVFSELLRQKSDPKFWASLTPRQCLQYDFKRFHAGASGSVAVGISSILKPIEQLLDVSTEDGSVSPQTIRSMEEFAAERDLTLVLVMSAVFEPKMKRQVLLFEPSFNGPTQFFEAAKNSLEKSETLQLVPHASVTTQDKRLRVWEQHNTKASRKALAPIVVDAVSQ